MKYAGFVYSLDTQEALTKAFLANTENEAHDAALAGYLDDMTKSGCWENTDAALESFNEDEDNGLLEIMVVEVAK